MKVFEKAKFFDPAYNYFYGLFPTLGWSFYAEGFFLTSRIFPSLVGESFLVGDFGETFKR